jgi:hypothetical protein
MGSRATEIRAEWIERLLQRFEDTERSRNTEDDVETDGGIGPLDLPQRVPGHIGPIGHLLSGQPQDLAPAREVVADLTG